MNASEQGCTACAVMAGGLVTFFTSASENTGTLVGVRGASIGVIQVG
jgi:hypothetical protein